MDEAMKELLDDTIEHTKVALNAKSDPDVVSLMCKQNRLVFVGLIAEGFDEYQALQIICSMSKSK